jgi:hypothetical protein
VSGFSDRGEHAVVGIPFVAYPVLGRTGQGAGFVEAVGVMMTAVDRVDNPRQLSGEGTRHVHISSVVWILARVQLQVCGPRPARQQGAVDEVVRGLRSSATGTYGASAVPSSGVRGNATKV